MENKICIFCTKPILPGQKKGYMKRIGATWPWKLYPCHKDCVTKENLSRIEELTK